MFYLYFFDGTIGGINGDDQFPFRQGGLRRGMVGTEFQKIQARGLGRDAPLALPFQLERFLHIPGDFICLGHKPLPPRIAIHMPSMVAAGVPLP
jgi:hypothetical protein